jgi:hypothetical protein
MKQLDRYRSHRLGWFHTIVYLRILAEVKEGLLASLPLEIIDNHGGKVGFPKSGFGCGV